MSVEIEEIAATQNDWLADLFSDADKLDPPVLLNWFADDIDLRIANGSTIVGRRPAEQLLPPSGSSWWDEPQAVAIDAGPTSSARLGTFSPCRIAKL